ncbi:MAG: capsule assembly Wzi family protein, partial [Treponema sp.]|nr:capsule assembly Wzi family protein [Treponema sp.]
MKKQNIFLLILSFIFLASLPAQEALKSVEEEYYGFLALQGMTARPYLNYRTLSDSVWTLDEDAVHPWGDQNLGAKRLLSGGIFMRAYGPELFTSINTAAPYGQNDGALWQGRGFNAALTGGVRFEGYGIELTFKPQLSFSQNAAFDIMNPEMSTPNYAGKGDTWGYFWGIVDAPQRFGDKPFFTFDWGDTEIRYTWKTLTIGFGTQAIWLGPAYLNSMLHSNNAPTYPKFDIGLRRQSVTIPLLGWYIGDIEARLWVGRLSESDYFDSDAANDHTMFHGLSFAYAPSFLPGLTLCANRVCQIEWRWKNLKYMFPVDDNTIEDQKMSFGVSWF